MRIETFQMERMQSMFENEVEYDLSESGVYPVSLKELIELGFDLDAALDIPLGYSQGNGTPELRTELSKMYPGTTIDNIEVTNGTSEANFIVCLNLLKDGDEFALQVPNYMQLWGVPRSLGSRVNRFRLRAEADWEPDWEEFEAAVNPKTRLVYVSNPNNPTGSTLSSAAMDRIVRRCEEMDALLLADEVYLGAEIHADRTASFWGRSENVVVTSGLSKAFGIPGVRIGWIVGSEKLIFDCWTQHDSLTICPNKLSDAVAQIAVQEENRETLYGRGRELLQSNLKIMEEWVGDLGEDFDFVPPVAGAICFIRYPGGLPSAELGERIRDNQSTLIVPGSHLGLEGYIRVWMGAQPDYLKEGLRRVREELQTALHPAVI